MTHTHTSTSIPLDQQPGPIYCAEQINIPKDLSLILKLYTKAVIRAQPKDVVEWSIQYFAEEERKRRLESEIGQNMKIAHLQAIYLGISNEKNAALRKGETLVERNLLFNLCETAGMKLKEVNALVDLAISNEATPSPTISVVNVNPVNVQSEEGTTYIDWVVFLAFASALVSKDLVSSIQNYFHAINTETIPTHLVLKVFQTLSKKDKTLTNQFVNQVSFDLVQKGKEPISFSQFKSIHDINRPQEA